MRETDSCDHVCSLMIAMTSPDPATPTPDKQTVYTVVGEIAKALRGPKPGLIRAVVKVIGVERGQALLEACGWHCGGDRSGANEAMASDA